MYDGSSRHRDGPATETLAGFRPSPYDDGDLLSPRSLTMRDDRNRTNSSALVRTLLMGVILAAAPWVHGQAPGPHYLEPTFQFPNNPWLGCPELTTLPISLLR
jgi:hypothetical protein